MINQSNGSPSSAADDQRRRQIVLVSSPPSLPIQENANAGNGLGINDFSLVSTGDKRKRERKLRSQVWQHFTKLMREDGTCEKCMCNYCLRLFTCTSKCGTTHLLRHITEGKCPAYKLKQREVSPSAYGYERGRAEHKGRSHPWKYDEFLGQSSSQQETDDELHSVGLGGFNRTCHEWEDSYEGPESPPTAIRMREINRKAPRGAQSWMNELRACASKLNELTKERVDFSLTISQISSVPDYSLDAAVKCLNELEDIPQSSEMYLDAFEILKDAGERECFICLSREPRRRWLQRMLQRVYPARYTYDTEQSFE